MGRDQESQPDMGEQHSLVWHCDDGAGQHCRKSSLQKESPYSGFDHVESEMFVKLLEGEDHQYLEVGSGLEDPLLPRVILHHWNTLASLLSPLTVDFKNKTATLKGNANPADAGNYRGHRGKL